MTERATIPLELDPAESCFCGRSWIRPTATLKEKSHQTEAAAYEDKLRQREALIVLLPA